MVTFWTYAGESGTTLIVFLKLSPVRGPRWHMIECFNLRQNFAGSRLIGHASKTLNPLLKTGLPPREKKSPRYD